MFYLLYTITTSFSNFSAVLLPNRSYSCYRMAGPLKASTGLAGLVVAQYPHRILSSVYQKILRTVKDMPENYAYRKNTQVTQFLHFILYDKGLQQCNTMHLQCFDIVGLASGKTSSMYEMLL